MWQEDPLDGQGEASLLRTLQTMSWTVGIATPSARAAGGSRGHSGSEKAAWGRLGLPLSLESQGMDRAEMESVSWKLPWKGSRRTLRHEQEDESLSPQCQHFSRTSRRGQESGERIIE